MDIVTFLKPTIKSALLLMYFSFSTHAVAEQQPTFHSDLYSTASAGIGQSRAIVDPNTNDQFYTGRGLGLSVGLAAEMPVAKPLTLTARVDGFNSLDFSTVVSSASASWGLMATAGIIIGDLHTPGQVYFSATLGAGFALLSDQGVDDTGNSICFLCSGKEGGGSAGVAGRLAIGMTRSSGVRVALVAMRVGGNGDNATYSNGEDAYLQTIMLQFTTANLLD